MVSVNNLAALLFARGKLSEAESLYREALEKSRAKMGEMHPEDFDQHQQFWQLFFMPAVG